MPPTDPSPPPPGPPNPVDPKSLPVPRTVYPGSEPRPPAPVPTDPAGAGAAPGQGPRSLRPHYGFAHWFVLTLFLSALGWYYVHVASQLVNQTNRDPLASDQKHNMKMALAARGARDVEVESAGVAGAVQRLVPHLTDGVVQPLWPWVASFAAPEGMEVSGPREVTADDEEFFRRGKWVNVGITGAFLIVFGMVIGRTFTLLGTVNTVLLIGLGAFLPRSVYFQPEPLYYVLFFLTWLCCVAVLKKNSLWLYAAMGLVAGLAYLAKASVTPLLGVFLLVSTYRFFSVLFPRLLGAGGSERRRACEWSCPGHFVGMVFLVFTYLLTAGPRLAYANERFGDPFHTYPAYWMWMDDFPEAYQFMADHPGKDQLLTLTDETRPSLQNYLEDHTGAEVTARVTGVRNPDTGRYEGGAGEVVQRFLDPPRRVQKKDQPRPWNNVLHVRGWYLAYLLGVLVVVFACYTRHKESSLFPSQRIEVGALPICLFVLGSFAAYALLYGWYVPIGKGDRFMLSLYAPLVFSLMAGAESIILRVRRRAEHPWILNVYALLQLALTAALAYRIFQITDNPTFG